MDPNTALMQIRKRISLLAAIMDRADEDSGRVQPGDVAEMEEAANELVDLWDGLDNWLCKGGFLPDLWEQNRKNRK